MWSIVEETDIEENFNIIQEAYIFYVETWFCKQAKDWGWDKSYSIGEDNMHITTDFAIP